MDFASVENKEEIEKKLFHNFCLNQAWTSKDIHRICLETGLRYRSVYKWYWSKKNALKLGKIDKFQLAYEKYFLLERDTASTAPIFGVEHAEA